MWCYRVMRRRWATGKGWGYSYGIYEFYPSINEMGMGWTKRAMEPCGDTLAELKADYELMAEAFRLPVLDYKTGKPIGDPLSPEGNKEG